MGSGYTEIIALIGVVDNTAQVWKWPGNRYIELRHLEGGKSWIKGNLAERAILDFLKMYKTRKYSWRWTWCVESNFFRPPTIGELKTSAQMTKCENWTPVSRLLLEPTEIRSKLFPRSLWLLLSGSANISSFKRRLEVYSSIVNHRYSLLIILIGKNQVHSPWKRGKRLQKK
jgi:hypothetical protein